MRQLLFAEIALLGGMFCSGLASEVSAQDAMYYSPMPPKKMNCGPPGMREYHAHLINIRWGNSAAGGGQALRLVLRPSIN